MSFIERETEIFTPKFREIFPWRETMLRVQWMKSDEKPFFCQIYVISFFFSFFFFFFFEKKWYMFMMLWLTGILLK